MFARVVLEDTAYYRIKSVGDNLCAISLEPLCKVVVDNICKFFQGGGDG